MDFWVEECLPYMHRFVFFSKFPQTAMKNGDLNELPYEKNDDLKNQGEKTHLGHFFNCTNFRSPLIKCKNCPR